MIPTITQQEVINFYEDYFIKRPRVLELHAIATVHMKENEDLKN